MKKLMTIMLALAMTIGASAQQGAEAATGFHPPLHHRYRSSC